MGKINANEGKNKILVYRAWEKASFWGMKYSFYSNIIQYVAPWATIFGFLAVLPKCFNSLGR
jgi:hypothetical protein